MPDPSPLRVAIVDDEPPARALVREYLAAHPQAAVVGEAASGREAVALLNAERPDLVVLDVQMPGGSGFDVLPDLAVVPRIIFSTAYDTYALQAFEAGAVDYLLKPYSQDRFDTALRRVLRRPHGAAQAEQLTALLAAAQPERAAVRQLLVRVGDTIVPVRTNEVLYIEAAGDNSILHLADDEYVCGLGIGALEDRLDPDRFARIHRSTIVALPALHRLKSDGDGGYLARLTNGHQIRISRTYAPIVRDLIV